MSREVVYKVVIDLTREQCWQIMQDITVPHKYVPGVIRTEFHTEQKSGVGASRRVFKKMMALDETVTEWNEGYGLKLRLHDGAKAKPFPDAYFIYRLADAGQGKTEFTAIMGYRFPLGAFGQLLDSLLIAPIVQGQIRDVALAVKYFYETNTSPTPADIKRLRKLF